jgi:hypothetical protein
VCNGVRDDVAYEELLKQASDYNWNAGTLAAAVANYKSSLKASRTPEDTEDAEEGETAPGAAHSAADDSSRQSRAQIHAAGHIHDFLQYANEQHGIVLAYRDDKARLKPLRSLNLSAEMVVSDFVDELFSE